MPFSIKSYIPGFRASSNHENQIEDTQYLHDYPRDIDDYDEDQCDILSTTCAFKISGFYSDEDEDEEDEDDSVEKPASTEKATAIYFNLASPSMSPPCKAVENPDQDESSSSDSHSPGSEDSSFLSPSPSPASSTTSLGHSPAQECHGLTHFGHLPDLSGPGSSASAESDPITHLKRSRRALLARHTRRSIIVGHQSSPACPLTENGRQIRELVDEGFLRLQEQEDYQYKILLHHSRRSDHHYSMIKSQMIVIAEE